MATAARRSGVGAHMATFEVFARSLPAGRRFGVFAGLGRLLELIDEFRFDDTDLDWLLADGAIDDDTASWLAGYRFDGDIDAYAEGELFFPDSPVLTVTAPFAAATLLETLVLSVLNHDSAIASAAARMRLAAGARTVIEMGSRRTHDAAAVAAARAAYIGGLDATSNLAAARQYGIPAVGTSAHAFVLAHLATVPATADDRHTAAEIAAHRAQIAALGPATTLLVDTFDIAAGLANAVAAARAEGLDAPGGVRLDSGDPRVEVPRAREILDSLGATGTKIVVTGDLDEHLIAELADKPVDTYGVGTKLVGGSGHPTCGFVMKLTAIATSTDPAAEMLPVAKASKGKPSRPGRHLAWREIDRDGFATAERIVVRPGRSAPPAVDTFDARALQHRVVAAGERLDTATVADARRRCADSLAELRPIHRSLTPGTAALRHDPT